MPGLSGPTPDVKDPLQSFTFFTHKTSAPLQHAPGAHLNLLLFLGSAYPVFGTYQSFIILFSPSHFTLNADTTRPGCESAFLLCNAHSGKMKGTTPETQLVDFGSTFGPS